MLADEISIHLGERKKFAMYLGVIKRIGLARARKIFNDVKEANAKNPRALFFWFSKATPRAASAEEISKTSSSAEDKLTAD